MAEGKQVVDRTLTIKGIEGRGMIDVMRFFLGFGNDKRKLLFLLRLGLKCQLGANFLKGIPVLIQVINRLLQDLFNSGKSGLKLIDMIV